ncbi:MAG: peptidoglycan recognition family protein [Myxococcota bacterium]
MRLSVLVLLLGLCPATARALDIDDAWSPRNRERPRRSSTRYIVLHTTEGASRGALAKLRRDGEAHYLVTETGRVLRIIDKDRVAYHAGTSMWRGQRNLDRISLGIEVAGRHDRRLRSAQVVALRELLRQLKKIYRLQDTAVLTHSMVAYGRPNKYHRYHHRGRKRCGMIFGDLDLRAQLGLGPGPARDPDVAAGRLRVADRRLYARLFPPREKPKRASSEVTKLARTAAPTQDTSSNTSVRTQTRGAKKLLANVQEVTHQWRSARALVGEAWQDETTIYLFPSGLVRTGAQLQQDAEGRRLLQALPRGTRVVAHRRFGGYVSARRAPSDIAGPRWNDPRTLYRFPDGRLVPGHRVDAARVPKSTLVFPPA